MVTGKNFDVAGTETNAAIAVGFLNLAFNDHNVEAAFDRYVGRSYRQHNPHAPDGAAASAVFLSRWVSGTPGLALQVHRVIADGELVAVHSHLILQSGEPGSAVVDVMRIVGGRIVEHWDVVQPIPEITAHDNGMF
jgi:predicted SnoaL-like aldol condensation-catalyzing enzyme